MGELIIDRFNGKEVYKINEAKLRIMKKSGFLETLIEIKTSEVIQNITETKSLNAIPTAEVMFKIKSEDIRVFDNFKIYIQNGFSQEIKEYITTFYYSSHQMMNDNSIQLSFNGKQHMISWTSKIMDVNYYDGSVQDEGYN